MNFLRDTKKRYTVKAEDEKAEWFAKRTLMHIGLVQKYLQRIQMLGLPEIDKGLLEEEMEHDASKWREPEYEPYIHTTWRYRQARLGMSYELPEAMNDKMNEATFHHIKNNRHHPEYWDDTVTIDCINQANRDKPSGRQKVDATGMPLTYIGSMMADWLAMSEEKSTNVEDWIRNNVNVRWEFMPQQVALMHRIAKEVERD